jgi:hypothetical protein
VRFQGGALYPMVVAAVVVLGMLLVVYARESREVIAAPTVEDHWHQSYGFFLCDTWVTLSGDKEESDANGFLNQEFARTGIHSHDDGVIHWHAFSNAATGSNAKLSVFLDVYGVELTDSKLTFPEDQLANMPAGYEDGVFEEDETKCVIDGEEQDASLRVVLWDNFADADGAGQVRIAGLDGVVFDRDAMAVTIAFLPDNVDVTKPPSAAELPTLALSDSNQITPEDITPADEAGTEIGVDESPADSGAPAEGETTTDTSEGETTGTDDG